MKNSVRGVGTVIGLAAIGPAIVGIVGFVAAIFAYLSGDFVAAGVLLIASALAFGLLSVAVLGR